MNQSLTRSATDLAVESPPQKQHSSGAESSVKSSTCTSPLVVLHVGCGSRQATRLHEAFQGPNWTELRLDIDPNVEPDIVASITDMTPIAPDSIDAIFSSHNLEHLEAHEVPQALAEFRRVLRPGGMLLVTLPDLLAVAQLIVAGRLDETVYTSPAGPVAPIDMLFGYRPFLASGGHAMAHRTGFTRASLSAHLQAAGFDAQNVWSEDLNLWALATKK